MFKSYHSRSAVIPRKNDGLIMKIAEVIAKNLMEYTGL
jgi:hypothetical protein